MGILMKFNKRVKKMGSFYVILCILIAICNMTVPYYLSSRNQLIQASQKFRKILQRYPNENLIENGELLIKKSEIKSDGNYSVAFLVDTADIKEKNYINFQEEDVDFSINGNSIKLHYKEGENLCLREFAEVIELSVYQLSPMNMLSAVLFGILHVLLLLCLYLMVSYFVLRKSVKYRVLVRYASIALALSSFLTALLVLTFTGQMLVAICIFTFLSAFIQLLLLFPDYWNYGFKYCEGGF